ncbi:MAG: Fic family protein [Planctomycetaceae bacterium]
MKESQHTEWMASWRDDLLRYVCGFANAEGGVLVIGRNDDGKLIGISNATTLLTDLPNKIRDLLGVVAEVNLNSENGRDSIEIVVPPYPNPISFRGHYYQRSGSTLLELKGAALDRFLLGRYGRTWDSNPQPGVTTANLSPFAISRFRTLAERSGRLDTSALAEPDTGLLQKLKLTDSGYLKRAAILLFHRDPLEYFSGAFVKIGFFRSEADLAWHNEVTGDLFAQAQQTLDLLFTKYLKAAVTYEDIVRIERFPVPREAMRETLLNALVHRDYSVPAPTQIRVFEDKLVVVNPAELPHNWTQETLLGPHYSHPFNPDIANAFFRAGEIEAWGRGVQRIFDACKKAKTPRPRVKFEMQGLWIEFPFGRSYLDVIRGKSRGAAPHSKTPPVAPPVTTPFTPPVTRLIRLIALEGELGSAAIRERLSLRDRTHLRNHYINPALAGFWIELTVPQHPTSRLQRYRLTAAGRGVLPLLGETLDASE